MLLYYIRHGDPVYDPDSLTEKGRKQAEALSERLSKYDFDEIYSSTSMRARLTAEPTAKKLGKEVKLLDWCNEALAWQEFTKTTAEQNIYWFYQHEESRKVMATQKTLSLGNDWHKQPYFADTHVAEGLARVRKNTYELLSAHGYDKAADGDYYVATNPNDKRIALFAHEGFGMAFLSTLTGVPYPTFCLHFGLEHSGVTVIRFDGADFVVPCVLQLSNDSHLYKSGLPLTYNNEIDV